MSNRTVYSFQHKYSGKIRDVYLEEMTVPRDIIDDDDPQSNSERRDICHENRRNYLKVARSLKKRGYLPLD